MDSSRLLKSHRAVSLGCSPGTEIFAICCVMVHRLDLNWRSDRVECLCCVRRRFRVSRPCHSQSPRHICSAEMAWNAVLLAGAGILCRIEYLGLKALTYGKLGIRYPVATLPPPLTIYIDWWQGFSTLLGSWPSLSYLAPCRPNTAQNSSSSISQTPAAGPVTECHG